MKYETCPCGSGGPHGGQELWEVRIVNNDYIKDWWPVCENHIKYYKPEDNYEIRPKQFMEQSQYKCKADKQFGSHSGPENYNCFFFFNGTNFPICEKHALGEPYGNSTDFSVTPMESITSKPIFNSINSIDLPKPKQECELAHDKFGYGECMGPLTHEVHLNKNTPHRWAPLYQKHMFIYKNAGGWEIRPFYEQPKIKKYDNYSDHQAYEKSNWHCYDNKYGNGVDGTPLHWGLVYKVQKNTNETYPWDWACENHVQNLLSSGGKIVAHGANNQENPCDSANQIIEKNGMITREKVAGGWPIRTQKAKGLVQLKNASFHMPSFKIYDVEGIEPSTLLGHFVRPCPVRPRHGFVDSRKIDTVEQAEIIIKETLAADPEAEFVVMPHINAEYSGIWTPGHLAVGLGTDGATAGKTAVTIPALGDALNAHAVYLTRDSLCREAGVVNAPYVELLWQKVYGELQTQFVQLRDGPKLPNQVDYIPATIKVENIIVAEGDLLAWEQMMRANLPVGTVIDHTGGTLASHYAIHAVLNHIPILISRKPVLGETLEPTQDKEVKMDIQALRAGFAIACETDMGEDMTGYINASYIMLAGCHHTTVWSGKYDLLLGFAMGCAWRLTVIASLGEGRHHDSNYKRRGKKSRDSVYSKAWEKTDTQYTRLKFMQTLNLFLNGDRWPGSNFGGKSWYKLAKNAVDMYNALVAKNPEQALEALNQLVHSAHNSGWGFNKFIEQRELDETAKNPVYASLKIAPFLYQILVTDADTLKAAARTWWKRSALELPADEGTGGNMEESSENEHEDCDCDDCQALQAEGDAMARKQAKLKKPHTVIEAQAKWQANNTIHIQWKAERMHGKQYFTKDTGMLWDSDGKFTSLFANPTEQSWADPLGGVFAYVKLEKHTDGWYVGNPHEDGKFSHYLLNLEETPNG